MRSELGSCPFCDREVETGSGRIDRPWSFRIRKPRFTEPSEFKLPRGASGGGDGLSDSGDPIELLATSIPEACVPWEAGTTRFRRLMTDFFIVTGL